MATFTGTEGDDVLTGGVEDDLLQGLGGDDTLDGGRGDDTLDGGLGDDRFIVGRGDTVVEAADAGIDTVVWTGTGLYQLADNVENAVAGGDDGVEITGNALDNDISGSTTPFASNVLDGGDGDDILRGGNWDDKLYGGAGNDLLIGQAGVDDSITIDMLDGGAGDDTMIGGDYYDQYWADSLGDVIIEEATPPDQDPTTDFSSADRVNWTGDGAYVLPLNVEYLILRDGATQGIGNDQANTLTSGYDGFFEGDLILDVSMDAAGGDDLLEGGAGADTLLGGDGNDYMFGADSADTMEGGAGDDYMLGDGFMNFIDFGDDVLSGGAGNDVLDGNIDDDILDGGDGEDVLIGGEGADVLTGGAGVDRFAGANRFVSGPNEDVALDYVDGEDLILGDFAEVTIAQDGADTIITFPDDFGDVAGTLRLVGVDSATITAEDFQSFIGGTIGDDSLEGSRRADFMTGGAGDDSLSAASGDDATDGGTGADEIRGGAGRDDLAGGDGADRVAGGLDDDRLRGDGDDDRLFGGEGRDFLRGGYGEDQLRGGAGDDRLRGGADADVFVFRDSEDRDSVADFSSADGDTIRIVSASAASFDDLTIRSDGEGGALVRWSGGQLLLAGVAPRSLDASDFEFASPVAFASDAAVASAVQDQAAIGMASDAMLGGSYDLSHIQIAMV